MKFRKCTCLDCKCEWDSPLRRSTSTANISGEPTNFCISCNSRNVESGPVFESMTEHGLCECGGKTRYYNGALGYEAHVCDECQEHWQVGQSMPAHCAHVDRYRSGMRNNAFVHECSRSACKAPLTKEGERFRIWNNACCYPAFRDYCMGCGRKIIGFNKTLPESDRLKYEIITIFSEDHVVLTDKTNPFKAGDFFETTMPVDCETVHWDVGTRVQLHEVRFDTNAEFDEKIRHLLPSELLWYVLTKDGAFCAFKPKDFFGESKRFVYKGSQ